MNNWNEILVVLMTIWFAWHIGEDILFKIIIMLYKVSKRLGDSIDPE